MTLILTLTGCSNMLIELTRVELREGDVVMLPGVDGSTVRAVAVFDDDGKLAGFDLDGDGEADLESIAAESSPSSGSYALDVNGDGAADLYLQSVSSGTAALNTLADGSGEAAAVVLDDEGGLGGVDTSGDGTADVTPESGTNTITVFSFSSPSATGVISGINISLTVPYGTDVTALVAVFTTSGVSVKVGSTVQVSGTTANDFTSPVIYTVTAEDGSTKAYTVTVTLAAATSDKDITAFSLPSATGYIDGTSINLVYGNSTTLTNLAATFTLSANASAAVSGTPQVSGTTTNDFSSPVSYRITAQDGSTKDYTVTVKCVADLSYRDMIEVASGTFNQESDTGADGTADESFYHTVSAFQIGTYELAYELWYWVRMWAEVNGYTFANDGKEGSGGTIGAVPTPGNHEPATAISWRDAVVWLNAYSEAMSRTPVYTYGGSTLKDANDGTACDAAVWNTDNNGYRLPSDGEWQYAASDRASLPHSNVAGKASYNAGSAYRWSASDSPAPGEAKDVGTKAANDGDNGIATYDMSGNVFELVWDWYDDYPSTTQIDYRGPSSGTARVARGGSWIHGGEYTMVGKRASSTTTNADSYTGFRVAANSTHELAVGDEFAGGYVFYLDGNGGGMVAATTDQSFDNWYTMFGDNDTPVLGTSGALGSGAANTKAIVSTLGSYSSGEYAAKLCDDLTNSGYSDWYLPSLDELNEMDTALHENGLGNFISPGYWSSTDCIISPFVDAYTSKAWFKVFEGTSTGYAQTKASGYWVRAVRTFNSTDILAFSVTNGTTTIDSSNHTIEVLMTGEKSTGTYSPSIMISDDSTVSPASGVATNFSSGVITYTVTSVDGRTQDWAVTVRDLAVGDSYGGGVVVHLLESGESIGDISDDGTTSSTISYDASVPHGLIAATEYSSLAWGPAEDSPLDIRDYTANFGYGAADTVILNNDSDDTYPSAAYAVAYSTEGYLDWYLPAAEEIAKMGDNYSALSDITGIGSIFWSSTESPWNQGTGEEGYYAMHVHTLFDHNSSISNTVKSTALYTRPFRSF